MSLLEQWEEQKRAIQAAVASGRISAGQASPQLARLDYRIRRRPLILKRRHDRRAWQRAQVEQRRAERCLRDERAREIEQVIGANHG